MCNTFSYSVSVITEKNDRGIGKPNEDAFLIQEEENCFLILDGVSRRNEEYPITEEASPVIRAARCFTNTFAQAIKSDCSSQKRLTHALTQANAALRPLREEKSKEEWGFYPGLVGLAVLLVHDHLYFSYVGDCIGLLLRDQRGIFFGEDPSVRRAEKEIPNRILRYERFCNRPSEAFSFGIFNGDDTLPAMIRSGSLPLEQGDQILLSTDGLANFLHFTPPPLLRTLSLEDILLQSEPLDHPPFASYRDDKTLIRITVTKD